MPTPAVTPIESLLQDCKAQLNRAKKAKHLETRPELVGNVWPILIALTETLKQRLDEQDEALEEIFAEEDEAGSVIYPDLATQIFAHLEIGKELVAKLAALQLNDIQAKDFKKLVEAYTKSSELLEVAVGEAALPPDDGEDGEEMPDEETTKPGEESTGDDDDEDEPASPATQENK